MPVLYIVLFYGHIPAPEHHVSILHYKYIYVILFFIKYKEMIQ